MSVEEQISENIVPTNDGLPWYGIRLFSLKQMEVKQAFDEKGWQSFIPMEVFDYEDQDHHVRHKLRPVVRNLIFLKKTDDEDVIRKQIFELPFKMSIITRSRTDSTYSEIPARQMEEFQIMCNPELGMKRYLSQDEAKLKTGSPVKVTHGPLKGLTGKLVRSNRKYYLLKDVPGLAVMLKVSRWCCEPLS